MPERMPSGVLGVVDEIAHIVRAAAGPRVGDFLALRRQLDAAARALDERDPERRFEILDLHRKRRLRDRAGVRRPAKMLLARQSIEIAQLLERDVGHQLD